MRCAEHIAFPLGKVARCGAARTVTDEGRPPAAGVLGTAVISEGSSVGLYPAAHRAAYFPLHAEVDTDTTYWNYTPTISAATACGLKPGYTGAKDTTINPLLVFKLKLSEPEKQTCTVTNDGAWCKGIDVSKIGTFR